MLWSLHEEWDTDLRSGDPLDFPGYREKLDELRGESVRTGRVVLDGGSFALIEGDFEVIGGSMGAVHGEKVVRALDRAVDAGLPVVIVTRSGGARMQEGMLSLVQMGRTAAAMNRHHDAGLLSVAVLRSPTTGGVFASYGSLADVRIAEADAVIGFAGPRVVEQTSGVPVDGRSHTAETALTAGLVDAVVRERELLRRVEAFLGLTDLPLAAPGVDDASEQTDAPVGPEADAPQPAWAAVLAARAADRPSGLQIAAEILDSWSELGSAVDPALRCAIARIGPHRIVVIATDRHAGDGRPGAAGFRLARRAVELAGRLGLPILSLVDTPGADPRSEAENDGIAGEIARMFAALAAVPVPTVSMCVGEGGSGGALALAVADRFLIQEHAIFSVIAPEGAAAILLRDAGRAPEVAPLLRLTSSDALDLGIVDAVVAEADTAEAIRRALDEVHAGPDRLTRWDEATARALLRPDSA